MNAASRLRFWWESHSELASLYKWLDERCEAPDVVEFLEKPWHWDGEYEEMRRDMGAGPVVVAITQPAGG